MANRQVVDGVQCACGEVAQHGELKTHLRGHTKEELVLLLAGWLCIHEPAPSEESGER
jgi:hypothetical protein